MKEIKNEGNNANFFEKNFYFLRQKKPNQYLKDTQKFCTFKNMGFILEILKAMSFLFSFLVFFCDHGPFTNVKISQFFNSKNHVFLHQI